MKDKPVAKEKQEQASSGGEGGFEGGEVVVSREDEGSGGEGGQQQNGLGMNVSTAVKFGKLGAILVFADVVTFFIMGRSVLGIMDDGGEEGWKEKVADKIMERAKQKEEEEAAAAAAAGEGSSEGGDDDAQPPAA